MLLYKTKKVIFRFTRSAVVLVILASLYVFGAHQNKLPALFEYYSGEFIRENTKDLYNSLISETSKNQENFEKDRKKGRIVWNLLDIISREPGYQNATDVIESIQTSLQQLPFERKDVVYEFSVDTAITSWLKSPRSRFSDIYRYEIIQRLQNYSYIQSFGLYGANKKLLISSKSYAFPLEKLSANKSVQITARGFTIKIQEDGKTLGYLQGYWDPWKFPDLPFVSNLGKGVYGILINSNMQVLSDRHSLPEFFNKNIDKDKYIGVVAGRQYPYRYISSYINGTMVVLSYKAASIGYYFYRILLYLTFLILFIYIVLIIRKLYPLLNFSKYFESKKVWLEQGLKEAIELNQESLAVAQESSKLLVEIKQQENEIFSQIAQSLEKVHLFQKSKYLGVGKQSVSGQKSIKKVEKIENQTMSDEEIPLSQDEDLKQTTDNSAELDGKKSVIQEIDLDSPTKKDEVEAIEVEQHPQIDIEPAKEVVTVKRKEAELVNSDQELSNTAVNFSLAPEAPQEKDWLLENETEEKPVDDYEIPIIDESEEKIIKAPVTPIDDYKIPVIDESIEEIVVEKEGNRVKLFDDADEIIDEIDPIEEPEDLDEFEIEEEISINNDQHNTDSIATSAPKEEKLELDLDPADDAIELLENENQLPKPLENIKEGFDLEVPDDEVLIVLDHELSSNKEEKIEVENELSDDQIKSLSGNKQKSKITAILIDQKDPQYSEIEIIDELEAIKHSNSSKTRDDRPETNNISQEEKNLQQQDLTDKPLFIEDELGSVIENSATELSSNADNHVVQRENKVEIPDLFDEDDLLESLYAEELHTKPERAA